MDIPKIWLKPGKEQSVRRFHPWVFSGAIQRTSGEIHDGEIAEVLDSKGNYLATGHCSSGSIAVRIFSFTGFTEGEDFWRKKIAAAFSLRKLLGLVGNSSTNIYRLIHAEGDGLPGLIVDIYGKTAVIQAHSTGMFEARHAIARAIADVMGPAVEAVYDRGNEKSGDSAEAGSYLIGSKGDNVCKEYDCLFRIDWEAGQKTGYFIDQRENRHLLATYAKGKKVLNTFCYTGGFSIHALKEGAELVDSLDSSQKALDLVNENILLNGFTDRNHRVIKADAVDYLKTLATDYDIVVLDPPAFAKHLSARHKAVQGYIRINEAAIRQIKPGGIIFTFSCSQVVDKKLFADSIMAAAVQAGRQVKILHHLHQPADHPVSIFHPEGEYLKGLVLYVE